MAAYTLTYYSSILEAEIDISDYVIRCDPIPFYNKNRDASLISEGFKFSFSERYTNYMSAGDYIYIWRDAVLIYSGYADTINFIEADHAYEVKVNHAIGLLKKKTVGDLGTEIDTFINFMLANSETVTIEGDSFTLISFKALVDLLFYLIREGSIALPRFSLDYTQGDLFIEPNFIWTGQQVGDYSGSHTFSDEVNLNSVWFLPQQIRCINQEGVFAPSLIVGDDAVSKEITLWQLLSYLCQIGGISFIPKDVNTFYVVCVDNVVGSTFFDDDDVFSIESEDNIVENDGISTNYSTLNLALFFSSGVGTSVWVNSGTYALGALVSYGGFAWICLVPHTSNDSTFPGNDNFWCYFFWAEFTSAINYYINTDAAFNGTNTNFWAKYISTKGVEPPQIDYPNNLNPIIVNSATENAWICSLTVWNDEHSCIWRIRKAMITAYTKKTITTNGEYVFDLVAHNFFDYASIYVVDFDNDLIELEFDV